MKLSQQSDYNTATNLFRAASDQYELLTVADPKNRSWWKGLAGDYFLVRSVLTLQGKTREAQALNGKQQLAEARLAELPPEVPASVAEKSNDSKTAAASGGLNTSAIIPEMRQKLKLLAELYAADPTTPRYAALVQDCLDFSRSLSQSPTKQNIVEAQGALAEGFALFQNLQKANKIAAGSLQEQQRLSAELVDAFEKLPK